MQHGSALEAVRQYATPLTQSGEIAEACAHASYVLIGEASHGTHEFYEWRAEITKQLIEHHGFQAVAVEADWPDAYRVNRYVQRRGADARPVQALADFIRFPRWMWRNTVVEEFMRWLHDRNGSIGVLRSRSLQPLQQPRGSDPVPAAHRSRGRPARP